MASAGIYKKGQGYWTRLMSSIAYGMLVLMGVVWVWDLLNAVRVGEIQTIYIQAAVAVVIIAALGYLGYWLIGRKAKVVDFMIATEGEMKKVNWSSRREILGSTWVVIGLTIFIAIWCLASDLTFQKIFKLLGVLE